jgi:hypothetical protein
MKKAKIDTEKAMAAALAPEGLVTIQEYARMKGVSVRTVHKLGMPIVRIQ